MRISQPQAVRRGSRHWERIACSREFQDLLALKRVFIIPAFVFFCVYYFALPVLLDFAPRLMNTRVAGTLNLAYLFALSQFMMGWLIAWLYLKAAEKFDRLAKDVLAKVADSEG